MRRNVLIFGVILGTIMATHVVIMCNMVQNNPAVETNDVLGYVAMVVVFSLIFFGIRNYRNKELNGVISLGQAFKTGALIAFVGSTMYVVVGLFYYYFFAPGFLDKYTEHVMIEAARSGATATELAAKKEEMAQFKVMYRNPLFAILISYAEVLPVGLVVALISSLILKRKGEAVAG
jgi:hypothetical protein